MMGLFGRIDPMERAPAIDRLDYTLAIKNKGRSSHVAVGNLRGGRHLS